MKHWIEKNYKTLIIAAFLVPIITVAIVSISHVTKWYGISNPVSWALYLSIGIEIAALSALAAISANMGNKVYFPFAVVTIVQFIGNIYFAYSYIDINGQPFKDWVGLVSPLVEFMGVEANDFVGHKRFLAFFAGGMLPIISLSFLHMLVKFTEEDRMRGLENDIDKKIQDNVLSADVEDENSRLKLSQRDLEILEKHLANPNPPNEALKQAAQRYSDEVREKHTHIDDFNETSVKSELTQEERGEILAEMMKNDQELGLYDEPFDNPLINPETTSTLNVPEMMLTTNQEIIESIPSDDEFTDWDVTLMDGLDEDESFFTDEEIENILQQQPTEDEVQQNFSTITPKIENNFQQDFITGLSDEEVMEMNQDEYERKLDMDDEFDGFVPEPFATPEEVEKFNLDESIKEYFDEKEEDPAIEIIDNEILSDELYEEVDDSDEDDLKKKS
jgi:hypothetical protein